ncbi:MAG TPA: type II toxin-antitoxin system RelE/ParE family toxin [Azonexus sp.]|nr:type II toxin-antitoxin system RelE/ParE family toxin [Azonexus sp.]
MNTLFHPEAEAELNAAIDWYEERQPGLGLDLAAEVQAAIERAVQLPDAWSELAPGIRRVLTHRFPYGVLYAQAGTTLHILAVMHLARQPGYWQGRH